MGKLYLILFLLIKSVTPADTELPRRCRHGFLQGQRAVAGPPPEMKAFLGFLLSHLSSTLNEQQLLWVIFLIIDVRAKAGLGNLQLLLPPGGYHSVSEAASDFSLDRKYPEGWLWSLLALAPAFGLTAGTQDVLGEGFLGWTEL